MPSESLYASSAHLESLTSMFSLIAKWKKPGYEKLCCIRCIQTRVRHACDASHRKFRSLMT